MLIREPLSKAARSNQTPRWRSAWVLLQQEVLVKKVKLTSYHQLQEFRKGQKEKGDGSPHVLPTSQNPSCWNLSWLSDAWITRKDSEPEWLARGKPETNPITDCKPQGTAALLGSGTLLVSTQVPIHNHVCISSPSSFPSVRQQPTLWPGKGSPLPATYWTNKEKKAMADLTMLRMNNVSKGSLGLVKS